MYAYIYAYMYMLMCMLIYKLMCMLIYGKFYYNAVLLYTQAFAPMKWYQIVSLTPSK